MKSYKYWDYQIYDNYLDIKIYEPLDFYDVLEKMKEEIKELESQISQMEELRKCKTDNTKRKEIATEIAIQNHKLNELNNDIKSLNERLQIIRRNKGIFFRVRRLKDNISRKEAVSIVIFNNDMEDGKIVTSTIKIGEEIYRLEEYGIYLTELFYEKLAVLIKDKYFDLQPICVDYIDNEIAEQTIKEFVKMCAELFKENMQNSKQETDVKKRVSVSNNHRYYYVPVLLFDSWIHNSKYKKLTNLQIKEALIQYGYIRGNGGRNECTVNGIGKTIRFDADEVAKVGWLIE